MIHIYTGDGKGKTTAALGLAVRALGWGKRVRLVQFMKQGRVYGESESLKRFENFESAQFGRCELLAPENIKPVDYEEAEKGLEYAREVLREKQADLLILDEINFALHIGLLKVGEIEALIRSCPPEVELVLTGRNCPEELRELADYVSEIKEIKHPYRKGTEGREGIEY